MAGARYTIDDLVALTGVSRRNIRYYVQEGLLPPPAGRGRGGFYYDSHLERLRRIRALQDQGLRLATIREHLAAPPAPVEEPPSGPLPAGRELWARHEVVPGLEVHVRRDVEERLGGALRELLRLARSLADKGGVR